MSSAQITDLYEVSMAHSCLREHMTCAGTFSLSVRNLPPRRGFLVAAGLESALDLLSGLRVDEEDVGVSDDAPYLDAAYKLVDHDGRPTMKLSRSKVTAPGAKQVFRGSGFRDTIAPWDEPDGARPLLTTVMAQGRRVGTPPPLVRLRTDVEAGPAELPAEARRITDPRPPEATGSVLLRELTDVTRGRIGSLVWTMPGGADSPAAAALHDRS